MSEYGCQSAWSTQSQQTMDIKEKTSIQSLKARGKAIPMDENHRYQWQQEFNALPAMIAFGSKLDISDDTVVKVVLAEILPQHLGGLGSDYVNGAVVAGLFDASLGVAGAVHYLGQPAGTVELSIKFIRAIHGPTVTAYAVALKRSDSVCFVEGNLFSEGRLCAMASGMVALATAAEGADELRW
ncbi:MAG: PaaI family thioesterase [Gammaproteobacteria bacterium]|nr:MAG: PaaI family thioesterase [Gammaproteobacteria bacterium]